jgi:gliding motility-associated-like protein
MIQIPNVLTPNDDGINDLFSVTINGAKEVKCAIVNRWGNSVFEYATQISANPITLDLWDAKLNEGKTVTEGVYFYRMEVKDMYEKTHELKGFFHVFK